MAGIGASHCMCLWVGPFFCMSAYVLTLSWKIIVYTCIHICKKSLYVLCDAPLSQSIKTALYVGKFDLGPNFPNFAL